MTGDGRTAWNLLVCPGRGDRRQADLQTSGSAADTSAQRLIGENFPLGEAMDDTENADHYEALQVSPRADHETIQRVFRHLAKRFHPDNADSGDPERFKLVMEAFRVLSHPKLRAKYDTAYEHVFSEQLRPWVQPGDTVICVSGSGNSLNVLAAARLMPARWLAPPPSAQGPGLEGRIGAHHEDVGPLGDLRDRNEILLDVIRHAREERVHRDRPEVGDHE